MSPVRLCHSCLRRFGDLRNTHPGIFGTRILWSSVIAEQFQGPLVNKSSYGRSAQMTMPARRASKFCANRRAVLLIIFFLSLTSNVMPGNIEPWQECQLEFILDLQPISGPSWN